MELNGQKLSNMKWYKIRILSGEIMCVENGITEDNYLNAEVMCKKFEDAIQRAVEEIVGKEAYFYCNYCRMCFSKKELKKDKYCKFCGAEAIDLRDYIG